jgi:hypothetical protein
MSAEEVTIRYSIYTNSKIGFVYRGVNISGDKRSCNCKFMGNYFGSIKLLQTKRMRFLDTCKLIDKMIDQINRPVVDGNLGIPVKETAQ